MGRKNKRDEFLSLIPEDAKKVLDVGCGDGGLGAKLKEKKKEVIGIDRDERLYNIARERLDKVFLADIENPRLPYPEGYFDCIIYADVLDCLIDPLALLRKHIFYLRDGGYMIASMANVRYYKVIIRLILGGTWDYVDDGILWKDHLRFFTLINMKELFMKAGYEIIEIKRNIFTARGFKILDFLFFHRLKELLTYQYYIKARKVSAGSPLSIKKRKIYKF